jgi:septal ring-binding cell division protein DamX
MRFSWPERAEAYDSSTTTTEDIPAALEPVTARPFDDLDAEHLVVLEEFRLEAERLGRAQARLSRGLNQIAARNAARILASDKPLTVREMSQLATTAAALASSGLATWGRAIGVERLLDQLR